MGTRTVFGTPLRQSCCKQALVSKVSPGCWGTRAHALRSGAIRLGLRNVSNN